MTIHATQPMDLIMKAARDAYGPWFASLSPEQRVMNLEWLLTAVARLGVEYFPPADVAAKLRSLAEAIESG